MLDIPADSMQPVPAVGSLAAPAFIEGIVALDGEMISVLDLGAIHRAAAPAVQAGDPNEPSDFRSLEITREGPAAFVS